MAAMVNELGALIVVELRVMGAVAVPFKVTKSELITELLRVMESGAIKMTWFSVSKVTLSNMMFPLNEENSALLPVNWESSLAIISSAALTISRP
jgi:hypothetical protein